MADWNSTPYAGGGDHNEGFDDNATIAAAASNAVCHNCGQEGHMVRECTEPRKMGACFNCGEEGHSKADCTKPRVFTGTCNNCSQPGHRAGDCPSKPKVCAICKEQNDHETIDCKNNYAFDMGGVADLTEAECWSLIKTASDDVDMDDFKDAIKALQKACPDWTYPALEKKLRAQNNRFHIIALEKDIGGGYTNVNLQGEINKTYAVSYFKSPNAPRPLMQAKWPKDAEDNLVRLADAGQTLPRGLPYCGNCEKFGHSKKQCDQDFVAPEQVKIICALCGEEGHRVRDCTQERKKPREPRTCKNCGSEDHIAKECDQPRKIVCRNCDQEGHISKDCEQPRKLICNNCEEEGHIAKDCAKPKDWSKVTCRHCGEKGHSSEKRCKPGAAKLDAGKDENNFVSPDGTHEVAFDNDFDNTEANAHSGFGNGANTGGWEDVTPTFDNEAPANGPSW